MKALNWILPVFLLASCITTEIPVQEYAMAKSAYDAAVANDAAKFAPQIFYKAEKVFKKAELLYKDRYYSHAREEFLTAQKLAERAETISRIKQLSSGEVNDD